MSGLLEWLEDQAPDIGDVLRRFPFVVVIITLATVVVIAMLNDVVPDDEIWVRVVFGLFNAGIFAMAGTLFIESRDHRNFMGMIFAYILPVLLIGLSQVQGTSWIVVAAIPAIGFFWLSVAGFTSLARGAERQDIQNRFWWLNHRAVTTAIVASVGFGIIALGTIAIERSLSMLFGLEIADIIYKFILPVVGCFLMPIYWLSTIGKREEFDPDYIDNPDFLSRAIGFLGQFVLAPLLVLYALILLVYAVQIAVTGTLPQGLLSWMVLVFTITGAATWLVLHPRFMHQRPLVRLFRRFWFWLTIVPVVLYAMAVWLRIDAYGLTVERVLLVMGGLWSGLLSIAYISRRFADIRLIPALAGALVLIAAVGPWNLENIARWSQKTRFASAVEQAGTELQWTDETAKIARGSVNYLSNSDEGDADILSILTANQIEIEENTSTRNVLNALGVPDLSQSDLFLQYQRFDTSRPVLVSDTPYLYSTIEIYDGRPQQMAGLEFDIFGTNIEISRDGEAVTMVQLADWFLAQNGEELVDPILQFEVDGVQFRILIDNINTRQADTESETRIVYLYGFLMASADLQEN